MYIFGIPIGAWMHIFVIGFIMVIFCLAVITISVYSISIKLTQIMKDVISIDDKETGASDKATSDTEIQS